MKKLTLIFTLVLISSTAIFAQTWIVKEYIDSFNKYVESDEIGGTYNEHYFIVIDQGSIRIFEHTYGTNVPMTLQKLSIKLPHSRKILKTTTNNKGTIPLKDAQAIWLDLTYGTKPIVFTMTGMYTTNSVDDYFKISPIGFTKAFNKL